MSLLEPYSPGKCCTNLPCSFVVFIVVFIVVIVFISVVYPPPLFLLFDLVLDRQAKTLSIWSSKHLHLTLIALPPDLLESFYREAQEIFSIHHFLHVAILVQLILPRQVRLQFVSFSGGFAGCAAGFLGF